MRGLVVALLVAALVVATGCGDDDSATSGGAGARAGGAARTASGSASGGGQSDAGWEGRSGEDGSREDHRGGEKSIEEFGKEAGESDRDSILATFDGYLTAVAEDDAATACSYLSAQVQQSLRQLVARGREGVDCAQILPELLAPMAATIAREQAGGEVTRVRVEGELAFVVFRAPGAKFYVLGLVEEGGEWKATTVAASVLVPDL